MHRNCPFCNSVPVTNPTSGEPFLNCSRIGCVLSDGTVKYGVNASVWDSRPTEMKLFEIRDAGTFMVVTAIKYVNTTPKELWLLESSGWSEDSLSQLVQLFTPGPPYQFLRYPRCDGAGGSRTLPAAHQYIARYWDILKSGDVVDVEYILGESSTPKLSQELLR